MAGRYYSPLDYGGAMAMAQAGVPDIAGIMDRNRQYALKESQLGIQQAEQARLQTAATEKMATQQAFRARVAALGANPTAEGIAQAQRDFPDFAAELKSSWDTLDKATKERTLQEGSNILSLALRDRKAAGAKMREIATTTEDTDDDALAAMLESDDEAEYKKALTLMGMDIAAKTGDPDKFLSAYGDAFPKPTADIQNYEYWLEKDPKVAAGIKRRLEEGTPIIGLDAAGQPIRVPLSMIPTVGGGAPGVAPSAGGPPAAALFGPDIERSVLEAIPGATVTSRQRSPEKNKAVGGVAGSMHLTDQARDFTPPKGMSMNEFGVKLRKLFPNADVLNEGDHIHVESRVRQAAGAQTKTIGDRKFVKRGTQWLEVIG